MGAAGAFVTEGLLAFEAVVIPDLPVFGVCGAGLGSPVEEGCCCAAAWNELKLENTIRDANAPMRTDRVPRRFAQPLREGCALDAL